MFHLFTIPLSQCAPLGSAERSTNTLLVTWLDTTHWLHYLPHLTNFFILVSTHYCIFASFSMFEFAYVWACICLYIFILVFIHLQSFHPSVPPYGLAEQSTNTVLATWAVHKFLIASPASPRKYFCFCFPKTIAFLPVPSCLCFIIPLCFILLASFLPSMLP